LLGTSYIVPSSLATKTLPSLLTFDKTCKISTLSVALDSLANSKGLISPLDHPLSLLKA
jgi:hypothetical protein